MPETSTASISQSSWVTMVPGVSVNVERTWTGTLYFLANSTDRICSTFAPMLAISSISSYETRSSLRAVEHRLGSVV